MSAFFGFIFFGIALAGIILFAILFYNSIKDKRIEKKIKEEINIKRILDSREGISSEQSINKYLNTMKGGKLNGGEERREEDFDRRTTKSINPISQPITSNNTATESTDKHEQRTSIQDEPNRQDGRIDNSNRKSGKSVEIDWS